MKILIIVVFFLTTTFVLAQPKAGLDSLTKLLETVYEKDRLARVQLDSIQSRYGFISDEVRAQWTLISKNDSENIQIVTSILDKFGWLSESKTSKTANTALFLVVQHANLNIQSKYLKILKQAVEEGSAKPYQYAYLLDRVNMRKGKFQIYGTQMSVSTNGKSYLWPIKNEPEVNQRRKSINLSSLEEVTRESGFVYHLPTKDDLKNKLVITGFVIETDQAPINGVTVKFGSKAVAKTNADGFYYGNFKPKLLKEKLSFIKKGYILSDPSLDNEDKEVYELNIMLNKK